MKNSKSQIPINVQYKYTLHIWNLDIGIYKL